MALSTQNKISRDVRPNVLVAGACGQLGRSIKLLVEGERDSSREWVFADKNEEGSYRVIHLDASDKDAVRKVVREHHIAYVINCVAYTNVDQEELSPYRDAARRLNVTVPEILAEVCAETGAKLVHISTDYVFSGKKLFGRYGRGHKTNPVNAYGRDKLAGEAAVSRVFKSARRPSDWMTIRTSWLFSPFGTNFVKKVRGWALEAKEKSGRIVAAEDEISAPTSTWLLANFIYQIVKSDGKSWRPGIWNFTGGRAMSRYEFAREILRAFRIDDDIMLIPGKKKQFPHFAERPARSVLDMKETVKAFSEIKFKTSLEEWRQALAADMLCIKMEENGAKHN